MRFNFYRAMHKCKAR